MTSLIATLLAFISVIFIVNRTKATWLAMMVGSFVAALGTGLSLEAAFKIALSVLQNISTLSLVATVVLIKSLGNRIQLPANNFIAANIIFRHIVYFAFLLYPPPNIITVFYRY